MWDQVRLKDWALLPRAPTEGSYFCLQLEPKPGHSLHVVGTCPASLLLQSLVWNSAASQLPLL